MSKIDLFFEHMEIRRDPQETLAEAVAGWKMLPWPCNTLTRDPSFRCGKPAPS